MGLPRAAPFDEGTWKEVQTLQGGRRDGDAEELKRNARRRRVR